MKRPTNIRIWLSRLRSTPVRTEHINEISSSLPGRFESVAETADGIASQVVETKNRLIDVQNQVVALRSEVAGAIADSHAAEARSHQAHKIIEEMARNAGRTIAFDEIIESLGPPMPRAEGLSILIITWNHAGWLPEALASARASLGSLNDEHRSQILILDDCSTDETQRFLSQFVHDPQIRVIHSPVNLNLARPRNVLRHACPTRHALILDADNRALPDGVVEVYRVAAALGSTIAYGQVIGDGSDGESWTPISYAPSFESLRVGKSFDSMAVIDVDAVVALGGYSTDPTLGGWLDDLELVLRCLRRGGLLVYVPTVLGRYRMSPLRQSNEVTDLATLERRIERMYLYDEPDFDQFAILAAHTATGTLWATSGATAFVERADDNWQIPSRRGIGAPLSSAAASEPRVLIISPGGVRNFGDDAITEAVIERVRSHSPTARIEIISDRRAPDVGVQVTPWSGTIVETWQETNGIDLGAFDLAIFAGGGNLASWFAPELLNPRCAIAQSLAEADVKVIWSGQGVGPCTDSELDLVARAARSALAFGCRDHLSVGLVRSRLGDRGNRAELVGDDAMGLPRADDDRLGACLRRAGVTTERHVVLHVRVAPYAGTSDPSDFAALATAMDELAFRDGATVIGIVSNDNSPGESQVLAALAQLAPRCSPWRIIDVIDDAPLARAILASADAVVTHSYHVALWSLEAGTPALLATGSEYYEAKAEGLRVLAGLVSPIAFSSDTNLESLEAKLQAVQRELEPKTLARASNRVDEWWQHTLASALND